MRRALLQRVPGRSRCQRKQDEQDEEDAAHYLPLFRGIRMIRSIQTFRTAGLTTGAMKMQMSSFNVTVPIRTAR